MKHSLQLKLSQHLTLTPQLQQSIRLLQLSTIELNQELERYLAENPLLERAEPEEGASASPPANGSVAEQETAQQP
jgi:RNA polymerase sigma-54 factor